MRERPKMATISINIPDTQMPRVLDAFTATFGYSPTLADGTANPETRGQFTRRIIVDWVKSNVVAYEANRDAENARQASITNAIAQITPS